ncbi:hypothetical protein AGMMS50255_8820 [Spirochaetia bacterium]|nr:hypothetical protein AGMMS50255_8820 [Spirochaetia bacterium]
MAALAITGTAFFEQAEVRERTARGVFGVYLDKKMKNIGDYVEAIKGNAIAGLKISAGRCDSHGNETLSLPVNILDADERDTGQDLWDFLKN